MPFRWRAQECSPPAVIAVASVIPTTCTGIKEAVLLPLPSRPKMFVPQQDMVPSRWSAQECSQPVVMVLTSVMFATATGAEYLSALPLPSW